MTVMLLSRVFENKYIYIYIYMNVTGNLIGIFNYIIAFEDKFVRDCSVFL
jgi:hypothetical protein